MSGGVYAKLVEVVKEWDPFQFGPEFYETEASDIVQIVTKFDDIDYIATKIQRIYFLSFEEKIAIERCKQLAQKLVELKNSLSHSCKIYHK
ncbi:DUF1871 family protein [Ectobacillus polymachus]|uniref:DUF1871 family protein n=1 Tax=Ectobacillus polymachus TaxID=1508806 RepID=UPI003A891763